MIIRSLVPLTSEKTQFDLIATALFERFGFTIVPALIRSIPIAKPRIIDIDNTSTAGYFFHRKSSLTESAKCCYDKNSFVSLVNSSNLPASSLTFAKDSARCNANQFCP